MSTGIPLRLALVASIVAVVHALAACSRSSESDPRASVEAAAPAPATRTASCDRITTMSVCSEYSGAYLAQNEAVHSSACAKLGGTFVPAECPNTSVLGSCTLSTSEVRKFYGSGGASYDAAAAEKECRGPYKGRWAAFK